MKVNLKPLAQQTIVITGASSGIGLVTARMAAKAGAKVVVAARNEEALQQLAEEIRGGGGQALAVRADVGNEEDVRHIAEVATAEFGGFDTWVNNAGLSIFGRCDQVTIEDQRRMFETVYWGVVYGSRTAVEHFKQRGTPGALVNVGSFLATAPRPYKAPTAPPSMPCTAGPTPCAWSWKWKKRPSR